MVLHLKVWESRTLPGLLKPEWKKVDITLAMRLNPPTFRDCHRFFSGPLVVRNSRPDEISVEIVIYAADHSDAGWSSLVARQAHNLKVIGSNPIPATNR